MKVYVVLCETCLGYTVVTDVEKVFSNEKKANQYAEEQDKMHYNSYHWVEEREVIE